MHNALPTYALRHYDQCSILPFIESSPLSLRTVSTHTSRSNASNTKKRFTTRTYCFLTYVAPRLGALRQPPSGIQIQDPPLAERPTISSGLFSFPTSQRRDGSEPNAVSPWDSSAPFTLPSLSFPPTSHPLPFDII